MVPIKKRLGYGGSGSIAGYQVLITGGSFDLDVTPSYLEMIETPPLSARAGRVQHADGIVAYSGTIAFDVHDNVLPLFSTTGGLLDRYYSFPVGINDGVNSSWMGDCKLTALTLSGAVGGLISASVSFVGLGIGPGSVANNFIRDTATPMGYWYSGTAASGIIDWNLSMSQDVTPMYRNESSPQPGYLKVGNVSYTLSVTSYLELATWGSTTEIGIGTKSFLLIGRTIGSGFSFGGITDLGTYRYTFETSSQNARSDGVVIASS